MKILCLTLWLLYSMTICYASPTPDSRIQEKVSYDGGYKRLHEVIADLSKSSGIAIYTGSSTKDWTVRDRPVIVYAKDIPLAKLIRSLTDACRLGCTSRNVRDEKVYRVLLTEDRARELADIKNREHDWGVAAAEWVWDSCVKALALPDSAFTVDAELIQGTRLWGGIFSTFTPEDKAKIISGEPVLVTEKWREWLSNASIPVVKDPDLQADRLKHSSVMIWFEENEPDSVPGLRTRFVYDDGTAYKQVGELGGVGPSWYKDPQMTSKPPESPGLIRDAITPGLQRLTDEPDYSRFSAKYFGWNKEEVSDETDAKEPVWRSSFLNKKITLKLLEKHYTFADVVRELAKTTGITFVCEDFISQKYHAINSYEQEKRERVDKTLRSETSLGEKLIALTAHEIEWLIDDKSNIIIGCPVFYIPRHENMLPQAYLDALKKKGNGPGLQLEDILALCQCTSGQLEDWVTGTSDLIYVPAYSLHDTYGLQSMLWKLYHQLTDRQRKMAKSATGLPLSSLDTDWVLGFFANEGPLGKALKRGGPSRFDDEARSLFKTLSDSSQYDSIKLRLKTVQGEDAETGRYKYILSLEVGSMEKVQGVDFGYFPKYSLKRAAELRNAGTAK